MKSIFFVSIVISGYISWAQSNSSKFGVASYYLLYGHETLLHGNQQFSSFSNTLKDDVPFDQNDTIFAYYTKNNPSGYTSYSGEISLRKPDAKWRFVLGASYNQRTERSYLSRRTYDYLTDTMYSPIPVMTGESTYAIYYDTLMLDSVAKHELQIDSRTTNVFVSAELLRDFKKNKYTVSTGFGIGLGMSVQNKVTCTYNQYWGLQMVKNWEPGYVDPVWYADVPYYSPVQGNQDPAAPTLISHQGTIVQGGTIFIIKPYIPIRVEAIISEKGFFSKVGVMGSLNAGTELQLVKNDLLRTRLFWNYKAGLFFRI